MIEVLNRIQPATPAPVDAWVLGVVLVVVAIAVCTPVWRWLRLVVTLVHELGHAFVGVACGRRFTGFVVRGDMSGHAVTSGKATGFGRVATTWAGYPMPALLGAGLIWAAMAGWAAPALTGILLLLAVALIRVRSLTTVVVMLAALGAVGVLWWLGADAAQQWVLLGAGLVLIVGAWRHLAAVAGGGGRGDDPAVLARLTRIPKVLWLASFGLTCAAATWFAGRELMAVGLS